MTTFTARAFEYLNNTELYAPSGVVLMPQRWSTATLGGYDRCELIATGAEEGLWYLLNWIGHRLRIENSNGTRCWAGRIKTVIVEGPGLAAGWTLDGVANRVRVAYLTPQPDGSTERNTTDWGIDTYSVDRFGSFELQLSQAESSDEQAEAYRDGELAALATPLSVLEIGSGSQTMQATIEADGYWHEFDQVYYVNLTGIEEHNVNGTLAQPLGYGFTTTWLHFEADGELEDFSGNFLLGGLIDGMRIIITGSAQNSGTWTVGGGGDEGHKMTNNRIYMMQPDRLRSTVGEFDPFQNVGAIRITGSPAPSNNGTFTVNSYDSADDINVNPNTFVNTSAGPLISIIAPQSVNMETPFVAEESTGQTVTVKAYGQQIAQSFQLSVAGSWTANEIAVRLHRIGNPIDSVRIALHANANGQPGAVLDSATLSANQINDVRVDWHSVTLGNTVALTSGVLYWITVSRTGAPSAINYYTVDLDEETGYENGSAWLHTGTSWVRTIPNTVDMPFRVRGAVETTKQITEIVTQSAQIIAGVELEERSNVYSNQYREGDATALTEIADLIESGYKGGGRMVAHVTDGLRVRIWRSAATATNPRYHYTLSGKLTNMLGANIEPGLCPVGEFALIPDVQIPAQAGINPFFMERTEYDATTGRWRIEPKKDAAPFDVGGVKRG